MQRFQQDSTLVDQMTRLKIKLLRKRLGNKKQNMDNRAESARSARRYDGQLADLQSALRRKQDLLQRLKEQHILESLHRPYTWSGPQRQYGSQFCTAPQPPPLLSLCQPAPILSSLQHPPRPPHIHLTLPQHPPSIIQQVPQHQPLTIQISSPQLNLAPQSGGIKQSMVELMLMQNAQLHQTITHNMMLKAMAFTARSPLGRPRHCAHPNKFQDTYQGKTIFGRPDVEPNGVIHHHHHHYGPELAASRLPPISQTVWLPAVPSVPGGQGERQQQPLKNHTPAAPFTLPPLEAKLPA